MEDISNIREEINSLDDELIEIISERLKLADDFAEFKFKNNISIIDKKREKEIVNDRYNKLKAKGIDDKKFINDIFKPITGKMKRLQEEKIKELKRKKIK